MDIAKMIVPEWLPESQYVKQEHKKTQFILHHTVSGEGVKGDIEWWLKTKERIATAFLIARDGIIVQCFSSKYWASALGIKAETLKAMGFKDWNIRNTNLDKGAVQIEFDSWGGLTYDKKSKAWLNAANKPMPAEKVLEYPKPYRGFAAFEKYTPEQLASCKALLECLAEQYKIPLTYNPSMFEVSHEALAGKPGIWTHTSYRSDKSDCHPQPELLEMLKSLRKS